MDEAEARMLSRVAQRLGIDDAEVRDIVIGHKDIGFVLPRSKRKRTELLWDYTSLIIADGRIEERELQMCERFCQRIGLRTGVTSSFMRKLNEWASSGATPDFLHRDFLRLFRDDTVFKE